MSRKRHSAEEIVHKLHQAEVELSECGTVAAVCKPLGVTERIHNRCRKE
jgi:putative transposase